MSSYHQKGEQYKDKHKVGSLEEAYLKKDELMLTRKAILAYKLRDPLPPIYRKPKNKKKTK
jgi:hypothetical protein